IETLREEILPLAQFAPYEAERAFFIFPDADISFPKMHPQAANALLKTLEEPKPRVHFILTSSRPFQLLATIRSRCQRIAFQRLDDTAIADILKRNQVGEGAMRNSAQLAGGNALRALHFADAEKTASLLQLATAAHEAVQAKETTAAIDCAELLSKSEDLSLA